MQPGSTAGGASCRVSHKEQDAKAPWFYCALVPERTLGTIPAVAARIHQRIIDERAFEVDDISIFNFHRQILSNAVLAKLVPTGQSPALGHFLVTQADLTVKLCLHNGAVQPAQ